jgi:hypothetical protein
VKKRELSQLSGVISKYLFETYKIAVFVGQKQ